MYNKKRNFQRRNFQEEIFKKKFSRRNFQEEIFKKKFSKFKEDFLEVSRFVESATNDNFLTIQILNNSNWSNLKMS